MSNYEASSRSLDFHICRNFGSEENDWACGPRALVRWPNIRFIFPRWPHSSIPFEKAAAAGHLEAVRLKAALERRQNSATIVTIRPNEVYEEEPVMDYFFVRLLANLGNSWDQLGLASIHLACAEHDHPIIHFP